MNILAHWAPGVVLASSLGRADFSVRGESSRGDMSPLEPLVVITRYRWFESCSLQVWHSLLAGGAMASLLAIGGALLFRRQLEHRVGAIRRTALEIEAGDLG